MAAKTEELEALKAGPFQQRCRAGGPCSNLQLDIETLSKLSWNSGVVPADPSHRGLAKECGSVCNLNDHKAAVLGLSLFASAKVPTSGNDPGAALGAGPRSQEQV